MSDFNKFQSNMNSLCYMIEKWERDIKFNKMIGIGFDYNILIDKDTKINEDVYEKVKDIYLEFNKLKKELGYEKKILNDYAKDKLKKLEDFKDVDEYNNYLYKRDIRKEEIEEKFHGITKHEAGIYDVDWIWYYEEYKNKLLKITKNKKEIVNCLVLICYEDFPKRDKKILWNVVGDWLANNIEQQNIKLPIKDENGEYEILGEKYTMKYA